MRFQKYLEAKKSIEEGCLNTHVLDDIRGRTREKSSVSILEAGAGVGSMVQHLIEHDVVPSRFEYTAVDMNERNVETGRRRLFEWGKKGGNGYTVERDGGTLRFDGERRFDIEFSEGDIYEYECESEHNGGYDLVVAHALLDILDLRRAVGHLLSLGDAFYFPVCFDGVTAFEPPFDDGGFDTRVERTYHETMDSEDRPGSSETGRRVFEAVRDAGGEVTSAGSSDWVVFPGEDGYTDDEEVLLFHILETVHEAVREEGSIDNGRLDAWLKDRKERVEQEELVYVAHQIDVAGLCRR